MSLPFPEIDPVAISLGPLDIRWYALAYLAGFLLGWRYGLYLASRTPGLRPNRDDIDGFMSWGVIGVILGGRLGYVLFYQAGYYLANPADILMVWHGGMSFHGGVIGIILALIAYSWKEKLPLLRLTDITCAAASIGLFFGRLANFINGELYGRVSDVPWAMVFPRGGDQPRHPSQLYEAALEGLVLFTVLGWMIHRTEIRERPGLVTGVFLAGYAMIRFGVEFVREPDGHLGLFWGLVSMGQMLCLPMFLLGAGVIAWSLYGPGATRK